jgi:hypothetical protein
MKKVQYPVHNAGHVLTHGQDWTMIPGMADVCRWDSRSLRGDTVTMATASQELQKESPARFATMQSLASKLSGRGLSEAGVTDPLIGRVLGVQIARVDKRVAPTVFVEIRAPVLRLLGPDKMAFGEHEDFDPLISEVRTAIMVMTGWDFPSAAIAVLPAPLPEVAPGEAANCPVTPGTFGSKITTVSGGLGITTAGHVGSKGATVYDSTGTTIGTVTESFDFNNPQAVGVPDTADIAAIDYYAGVTEGASPVASPSGPVAASIWDILTSYGALSRNVSAAVLSAGAPFASPNPAGANWGEAILTAYAISAQGDSGAPVYDQHTQLVGHVVGGYPGVYSVIQDATYQLGAVTAQVRW